MPLSPPESQGGLTVSGVRLRLLIAAVLAVLLLFMGGAWFYLSQKEYLRSEAEATMNAVVRLKVEQLVRWRYERLTDVSVLIDGLAADKFREWLVDPRPEKSQTIYKILRPRQQYLRYSDLLMVDSSGMVLLSLSGKVGYQLQEEALQSLVGAFRDRRSVLTDLHVGPGDLSAHLDVIGPIFAGADGSGPPVGAVVMRSDVREFLYPLIQSWPTASHSAETMLIRREGDSVLVLNDLRHQKDTAFTLRLPLSRTGLPSVMAVLGREGVVRTKGYRGVEVLAALKAVPDSAWFVSAQIDADEVFESWRAISALLLGLILMVFAAIVTAVGFIWQQQGKAHYKALFWAEKELQAAREDWENIFQAIGHPIFIMAPDQTVLAVNNAWERVSGQPGSAIVGRKCYEVMHGSSSPPLACPFLKLVCSRGIELAEMEVEALNRNFLISCTPVLAPDGTLEKVIHVGTDITKTKEAEAEKAALEVQLLQSQKMEAVGTLAGGIAHDFNNILTPIIGYSELGLQRSGIDPALAEDLRRILTAAHRARDLVAQILAFSRKTAIERTPVQIGSLVKEVVKLLRASLPASIEIRQNISLDCGKIYADPTQIHQILMNLGVNAYHAMEDAHSGVLGISLAEVTLEDEDVKATVLGMRPGPYVLLEVSDTGCGMDQATLAKVFDPYFTTKDKDKGTGLGLATVHGIMKAYGGHIAVYSEPGTGTCFRLYFPVAASDSPQDRSVQDSPLPRGNGERIMVVDDESVIVDLERSLLEGMGYAVTGFTDSEEALRALRVRIGDFDLVISDMTMPKVTGLDLLKEIKALRPALPIILCTGFSELINEEIAAKYGVSSYLKKPLLSRDLAVAVRGALNEGKRA